MTKICLFKSPIFWILLVIVIFGFLFSSYHASKLAAESLVGDSLDLFPLNKTIITIEPFKRNQIVWLFKYSHPGSYDEEFYIYTSLCGKVVLTNPKDLDERLKRNIIKKSIEEE